MEIKIEYNGAWPNLCSGDLFVTIDGKRWTFPDYCLSSGGGITNDYEDVVAGPWSIDEWPRHFPEELKASVLNEINDKITKGCCGGCI